MAWSDGDLLTPDNLNYKNAASVYNILNYGAVASTDSAAAASANVTAINAALTACYAAGGGVVLIPAGSFYINAAITMPGSTSKSVLLTGVHREASRLLARANSFTMIDHAGPSAVEELTLDGNGYSSVIGVDMNTNCSVRGLYLKSLDVGLDYVGVSASSVGVFYTTADWLYIDTCGDGIRMQTTPNSTFWVNSNQVFNAQIRGCTRRGVLIDGASGATFYALDCETNAQGVRIVSGQGTRIYGNWFEKNPNPIVTGQQYHLHIAYTTNTSGTVIHANGLQSWVGEVNTTGSMSSGSPTLTVASATNIEKGKVLLVTGAGAAGADLYSEVIGVSGTTITLADNASTLVSGVVVRGPQFVTTGSYQIMTEQYLYNFGSSFNSTYIPTFKPTISGSRAGSVALDELLTFFEGRGTITDSTTNTYIALNDTSDANVTIGAVLNQGANDDKIISLKSSDVAHGITGIAETDTYGQFGKQSSTAGGLWIQGFRDADGNASGALALSGYLAEAADTTKTTAAEGVVRIFANINSGSSPAAVGADGNLLTIENFNTTRFIFDAEGSAHADIEWTTFDDHADLAVIEDMETLLAPDKVRRQFGEVVRHDRAFFENAGLLHDVREVAPGRYRGMLNTTKAMMLAFGALRQIGGRMQRLEQAVQTLLPPAPQ